MKKLIALVLLVLVGAVGWGQEIGISLRGKWQLTTQFCQSLNAIPYGMIDGEQHPFIAFLWRKDERKPEEALEIQSIEFMDANLAILTTTKGVVRAFFELLTPTPRGGGKILFTLQRDDLFGAYFARVTPIHFAVIDEQLLRFSYLLFIPTKRVTSTDTFYATWNFLGEMKKSAK